MNQGEHQEGYCQKRYERTVGKLVMDAPAVDIAALTENIVGTTGQDTVLQQSRWSREETCICKRVHVQWGGSDVVFCGVLKIPDVFVIYKRGHGGRVASLKIEVFGFCS